MKSIRPIHLALTLGLAFACDVTEDPTTPTGPTVSITSPATGTIHKDAVENGLWPVTFSVGKFTLAAAGNCVGDTGCGHAQGFLDGLACGMDGKGPQLVTGTETSMTFDVGKCPKGSFFGKHNVSVQLVKDDDKSLVLDSSNTEVHSHIEVIEQATYVSAAKVLGAKCAPCHTGGASGGHNIGTSFADAMKTISAAAPKECKDAKMPDDMSKWKKVAECAVTRIKDGSMPLDAHCSGDPSKDSGNAACLTAAELNVVDNWVSSGILEK